MPDAMSKGMLSTTRTFAKPSWHLPFQDVKQSRRPSSASVDGEDLNAVHKWQRSSHRPVQVGSSKKQGLTKRSLSGQPDQPGTADDFSATQTLPSLGGEQSVADMWAGAEEWPGSRTQELQLQH
eukprot:m.194517 g.194517  ORF g.194517 m.194517 type:complete len:124 (-) comp53707_c0_seq12:815-1186(-)